MIKEALQALKRVKRPVIIYGAGIRLANAVNEARDLAALLGTPVAVTWGARDLFPEDFELCVGGFGTHGTRAANFTVQNADWILSVGSRLDSKATGTPRNYFARAAEIFMVDIDPAEIRKFGGILGKTFTGVQADAKMFLRDFIEETLHEGLEHPGKWDEWLPRCFGWKDLYPACRPEYRLEEFINPYVFVDQLSAHCQPGEIIVSDTGLSLAWMMQGFKFKEGQRFLHAFNQTPMGYGLPAAIGAAYANPGKRIILINGDGSFMLNIQELALLARHRLPIKIILFNNDGHAMCRQTQEQWLGGKYYSTSVDGGLSFPNLCAVVGAHGLRAEKIDEARSAESALTWLLADDRPAFLDVKISGGHRLIPQVQMGKPNEDGNPPLSRDELARQMFVGVVK